MNEKKRILVVEDHECIRVLLTKFLEKDYDVTTQQDGLTGLAWMMKGNIPDLIILDMSLPKLNGVDFLTNIRTSNFFSQIPVVVVSGEENKEVQDNCRDLGISAYLAKPFNPLELNTKIKLALKQKTQSSSI